MNNENLELLKAFAHKLSTCKYNLPVDLLIKQLGEGRFGYTIEGETVCGNDFAFAEDVNAVLTHIQAIFKEPHIYLKREDIVRLSDLYPKVDKESTMLTIKDAKLWKVREDEKSPEYIHTYVQEDDLAIYENKFVCFLIDELLNIVTVKLNNLYDGLNTVNVKVSEATGEALPEKGYETKKYVSLADVNVLPDLYTAESANANVIAYLTKCRKKLYGLKEAELYKACKKKGDFDIETLRPTNLLMHDKHYNYCYTFYVNYLKTSSMLGESKNVYFSFVVANLLKAFADAGFALAEDNEDIRVTNTLRVKFDCIKFEKYPFTACVSAKDDDVVIEMTETVDGNKGLYTVKVLSEEEVVNTADFVSFDDFAEKLAAEKREDVVSAYFFTDGEVNASNALRLVPACACVPEKLGVFVNSLCLYTKGSEFVYSRHCPVCGSTFVAQDDSGILCADCDSLYHIFTYDRQDYIWIKRLPKVEAKSAINMNKEAVPAEPEKVEEVKEEPIVEEIVATEIDEEEAARRSRIALKKNFLGKMMQAGDDIQNAYNAIKNYLLSFKGVKSRISNAFDSFNVGREQKVKVAIKGKTMVMYLALDPDNYMDSKYFPKSVKGSKKLEETPMLVKVKSDRGLKHALELIDIVLDGTPKKKIYVEEDFRMPYKTDEELIQEGYARYTDLKV